MGLGIRLRFEAQRSLAFGSISNAYAAVGAAMANPIRMLVLQNLTDVTLQFSFDGVADTIPLPSSGAFAFDIATNKTIGDGFFLAQGDRVYVKHLGSAPTTGSVYVTAFYGYGD